MPNIRNQPCPCGSRKKYKKCCLIKGTAQSESILSDNVKHTLDAPHWYHGTDQVFDDWLIPPPPKPGQEVLVPHTANFFTSNDEFARPAGKYLAVVSLSSNAKTLDACLNYEASEKLRLLVAKNPSVKNLVNIQHDSWHEGWLSGDVLRATFNNSAAFATMKGNYIKQYIRNGYSNSAAHEIFGLNTARGLIELICVNARQLGFDAIIGHEVDRHSEGNAILVQPWLAALSKKAVSKPKWLVHK